ncbi:MAG: hypothetical protein ACXVBV_16905, partial [Isosphaeraceae bacterium]
MKNEYGKADTLIPRSFSQEGLMINERTVARDGDGLHTSSVVDRANCRLMLTEAAITIVSAPAPARNARSQTDHEVEHLPEEDLGGAR